MKHRISSVFAIVAIAFSVGMPAASDAAFGTQQAPRLMNVFFDWRLQNQDQAALAKWDVIVLDMDFGWQFPERIRKLRHDNPRLKILAYVSAGELAQARAKGDPASPGYVLAHLVSEAHFLHAATGARVSDWPGSDVMNVTDMGSVPSSRWNVLLPTFIHDRIISTGLWDGIFLDTAYDGISSRVHVTLDPDGNGIANASAEVDAAWQAGMKKLITNVRTAIGPKKLLMENGGMTYASLVNGVFFENVLQYGWASPFEAYRTALQKNVSPSLTTINANTLNRNTPTDYQRLRYGFTTAMLGDGYFSFDVGDQDHAQTWWYDEYDAFLGAPKGIAQKVVSSTSDTKNGLWMRQYAHGLVLTNSDDVPHAIDLPAQYEKIRGSQDRAANDGSFVRALIVPAHDGVVLLTPLTANDIREAVFPNGQVFQVFSGKGEIARQPFSAQASGVSRGVSTIQTGDGDTPGTLISAQNGRIVIRAPGRLPQTIAPFGTSYRGPLAIAMTRGASGAQRSIIAMRTDQLSSTRVCRFSMNGFRQNCFNASSPPLQSPQLAVGDVDGSGQKILIASRGEKGIRVQRFSLDGTRMASEFTADISNANGDFSMVVADIDGDWKSDIIIGSGAESLPSARIFDANGSVRRELRFGNVTSSKGIALTASDLNRDGIGEILVGRKW